MVNIDKNKEFRIFIDRLKFAYRQFLLFNELQNRRNNETWKMNDIFWEAILASISLGHLSELAKMFEKQNPRFDDVFSIHYFTDYDFANHGETIEKLIILGKKYLKHYDVETYKNLEIFFKDLKLTTMDIENLFDKMIDVTEKIRTDYGIDYEIKPNFLRQKEFITNTILNLENTLNKGVEKLKEEALTNRFIS